MTKWPKETVVDGSPFYLTRDNLSNEKLALSNAKWFKPQPMGVNKLNTLMRDCAKAAGLGTDSESPTIVQGKRLCKNCDTAMFLRQKLSR